MAFQLETLCDCLCVCVFFSVFLRTLFVQQEIDWQFKSFCSNNIKMNCSDFQSMKACCFAFVFFSFNLRNDEISIVLFWSLSSFYEQLATELQMTHRQTLTDSCTAKNTFALIDQKSTIVQYEMLIISYNHDDKMNKKTIKHFRMITSKAINIWFCVRIYLYMCVCVCCVYII